MKSLHFKYLALFVLMLAFSELQAQETITATGGNVSGYGGSVTYTVGQVFYQTQNGSKGAISEGVQHPYHISVVHEITTGAKEISLSVLAYPNPTTHMLNLEVDNYGNGKMEYLVSDIQGKLLQQVRIIGHKTSIDMAHLPPSTYILNFIKDNHLVKTFKIIKK